MVEDGTAVLQQPSRSLGYGWHGDDPGQAGYGGASGDAGEAGQTGQTGHGDTSGQTGRVDASGQGAEQGWHGHPSRHAGKAGESSRHLRLQVVLRTNGGGERK